MRDEFIYAFTPAFSDPIGLGRDAPLSHLGKDRKVEVAVECHRQRPRDRRRRHKQHVRIKSLLFQPYPLVDAEFMLLVYYSQAKIFEFDVLLYKRVSPDYYICPPLFYHAFRLFPSLVPLPLWRDHVRRDLALLWRDLAPLRRGPVDYAACEQDDVYPQRAQ